MNQTTESLVDELTVPCAAVKSGSRHRRDMGDLQELADSIETVGLLQPIVVTARRELVCGERRLRAVRDILKRDTIRATVVDIESIASGEYAENEIRKEFTTSERVAIASAVKAEVGERRGGNQKQTKKTNGDKSPICPTGARTADVAAKQAGFSNRKSLERAEKVVQAGTPKLIGAMDDGEVSISRAAQIAGLPKEEQDKALAETPAAPGKVMRKTKPMDEPETLGELMEQAKRLLTKVHRQLNNEMSALAEKYGKGKCSSNLGFAKAKVVSARRSIGDAARLLSTANKLQAAGENDSAARSGEDTQAD